MKMRVLAGVALVALAGAIGGAAMAFKVGDPVKIPTAADDFRLVDHTGFAQNLRRLVDVKAIVIVSQLNGDEGSRKAAKALAALQANNADVQFLMLNSDLGDGRDAIAAEARAQGYAVPVMDDEVQLVGEQLGVSYAGQAFVLQPRTLKVLYSGAVDGVAPALADIAAGKAVAKTAIKGSGAAISFPERERRAEHGKISYSKDVAPILAAKCVACHQEGGIGPFAMDSYDVVKGFSGMIRESIRTDTMPPWHPDATIGKFKHDASLTNAQVKTIVHWVEAGAPRGDGGDPLKEAASTAPEWPLGKPDLIVNAPAYTIPASGVVQYQYPTAVNPLTEGRWVKAASIMPGDRRGVHHILAGYIPGTPRPGPASAGQWEQNYGEYAVGGESFRVPDGLGIFLPAGGHMGFQFHYTPYGKEGVDNSKIGFYFYPEGEAPEKVMHHTVIADNFIELPPEKDMHEEIAYLTFPKDALLYSIFLHTHYRGQAGRVDMIRADGTKQTLINLPRYDFNWQRTYDFAEPVLVPKGAKLVATYYYDNSVRNASNPDPKAKVIWGDQSWEEMHYTSIYYQWTDETVAKPADATDEMRQMRIVGMLDDNLDDKIQLTEVKGRIAGALKPRFATLDVNKDDAVDMEELKAATDLMMMFGSRRDRDRQPPPTP